LGKRLFFIATRTIIDLFGNPVGSLTSLTKCTAVVAALAAHFFSDDFAGPSTGAEVLKVLKKGDALTVIEEAAAGWIHVEHEGKRGYISKALICLSKRRVIV
jgi:hypothetical protein